MEQSRTRLLQSFSVRRVGVGNWNRLSKDIVSVDTLVSFKTQLGKLFIRKGLAYKY